MGENSEFTIQARIKPILESKDVDEIGKTLSNLSTKIDPLQNLTQQQKEELKAKINQARGYFEEGEADAQGNPTYRLISDLGQLGTGVLPAFIQNIKELSTAVTGVVDASKAYQKNEKESIKFANDYRKALRTADALEGLSKTQFGKENASDLYDDVSKLVLNRFNALAAQEKTSLYRETWATNLSDDKALRKSVGALAKRKGKEVTEEDVSQLIRSSVYGMGPKAMIRDEESRFAPLYRSSETTGNPNDIFGNRDIKRLYERGAKLDPSANRTNEKQLNYSSGLLKDIRLLQHRGNKVANQIALETGLAQYEYGEDGLHLRWTDQPTQDQMRLALAKSLSIARRARGGQAIYERNADLNANINSTFSEALGFINLFSSRANGPHGKEFTERYILPAGLELEENLPTNFTPGRKTTSAQHTVGRIPTYAVPYTTLQEDSEGNLSFVPRSRDDMHKVVTRTGQLKVNKKDMGMMLQNSQLTHMMGLNPKDSGSFGLGYDENGSAIFYDENHKPVIVAMPLDDIYEREGGYLKKDRTLTPEGIRFERSVDKRPTYEGKRMQYVYSNGESAFYADADRYDAKVSGAAARGLGNPFWGYDPTQQEFLIPGDYGASNKHLAGAKRIGTQGRLLSDIFSNGIDYNKLKFGTFSVAAQEELNKYYGTKTYGNKLVDGAGFIDPAFSSFSFMARSMGEGFKGVLGNYDWRDYLRQTVKYTDEAKDSPFVSFDRNDENGEVTKFLMPSVAFKQLSDNQRKAVMANIALNNPAFLQRITGGDARRIEEIKRDAKLDEKIGQMTYGTLLDDFFQNLMDPSLGGLAEAEMLKTRSQMTMVPEDEFVKFASHPDNHLYPNDPAGAAKFLQAKRDRGLIREIDGKRFVQLNAQETNAHINAAMSDSGLFASKADEEFNTENNWIGKQLAEATGFTKQDRERSAQLIAKRLAEMEDVDYWIGKDKFSARPDIRQRFEEAEDKAAFVKTDPQAIEYVKSQITGLRKKSYQRYMLPNDAEYALAFPMLGSFFENAVANSGASIKNGPLAWTYLQKLQDPEFLKNELKFSDEELNNVTFEDSETKEKKIDVQKLLFAPGRGREILSGRSPSAIDTFSVMANLGSKGASLSSVKGGDNSLAMLLPEAINRMNTGDFDGDTIWMYSQFSKEWRNNLDNFNKYAQVRPEDAAEIDALLAEQKEQLKGKEIAGTLGKRESERLFLYKQSQGEMGKASAIMRNALDLYDLSKEEDRLKFAKAYRLGSRYYDFATSEGQKEGWIGDYMEAAVKGSYMASRQFSRFQKLVSEDYGVPREDRQKDQPSIFSHRLRSLNNLQDVGAAIAQAKVRRDTGDDFGFGDMAHAWVNNEYGVGSKGYNNTLFNVANEWASVLIGQNDLSKVLSKQELETKFKTWDDLLAAEEAKATDEDVKERLKTERAKLGRQREQIFTKSADGYYGNAALVSENLGQFIEQFKGDEKYKDILGMYQEAQQLVDYYRTSDVDQVIADADYQTSIDENLKKFRAQREAVDATYKGTANGFVNYWTDYFKHRNPTTTQIEQFIKDPTTLKAQLRQYNENGELIKSPELVPIAPNFWNPQYQQEGLVNDMRRGMGLLDKLDLNTPFGSFIHEALQTTVLNAEKQRLENGSQHAVYNAGDFMDVVRDLWANGTTTPDGKKAIQWKDYLTGSLGNITNPLSEEEWKNIQEYITTGASDTEVKLSPEHKLIADKIKGAFVSQNNKNDYFFRDLFSKGHLFEAETQIIDPKTGEVKNAYGLNERVMVKDLLSKNKEDMTHYGPDMIWQMGDDDLNSDLWMFDWKPAKAGGQRSLYQMINYTRQAESNSQTAYDKLSKNLREKRRAGLLTQEELSSAGLTEEEQRWLKYRDAEGRFRLKTLYGRDYTNGGDYLYDYAGNNERGGLNDLVMNKDFKTALDLWLASRNQTGKNGAGFLRGFKQMMDMGIVNPDESVPEAMQKYIGSGTTFQEIADAADKFRSEHLNYGKKKDQFSGSKFVQENPMEWNYLVAQQSQNKEKLAELTDRIRSIRGKYRNKAATDAEYSQFSDLYSDLSALDNPELIGALTAVYGDVLPAAMQDIGQYAGNREAQQNLLNTIVKQAAIEDPQTTMEAFKRQLYGSQGTDVFDKVQSVIGRANLAAGTRQSLKDPFREKFFNTQGFLADNLWAQAAEIQKSYLEHQGGTGEEAEKANRARSDFLENLRKNYGFDKADETGKKMDSKSFLENALIYSNAQENIDQLRQTEQELISRIYEDDRNQIKNDVKSLMNVKKTPEQKAQQKIDDQRKKINDYIASGKLDVAESDKKAEDYVNKLSSEYGDNRRNVLKEAISSGDSGKIDAFISSAAGDDLGILKQIQNIVKRKTELQNAINSLNQYLNEGFKAFEEKTKEQAEIDQREKELSLENKGLQLDEAYTGKRTSPKDLIEQKVKAKALERDQYIADMVAAGKMSEEQAKQYKDQHSDEMFRSQLKEEQAARDTASVPSLISQMYSFNALADNARRHAALKGLQTQPEEPVQSQEGQSTGTEEQQNAERRANQNKARQDFLNAQKKADEYFRPAVDEYNKTLAEVGFNRTPANVERINKARAAYEAAQARRAEELKPYYNNMISAFGEGSVVPLSGASQAGSESTVSNEAIQAFQSMPPAITRDDMLRKQAQARAAQQMWSDRELYNKLNAIPEDQRHNWTEAEQQEFKNLKNRLSDNSYAKALEDMYFDQSKSAQEARAKAYTNAENAAQARNELAAIQDERNWNRQSQVRGQLRYAFRGNIARGLFDLRDRRESLEARRDELNVRKEELKAQKELKEKERDDYLKNGGSKDSDEYKRLQHEAEMAGKNFEGVDKQLERTQNHLNELTRPGAAVSSVFKSISVSALQLGARLGKQVFQKGVQEAKRFLKEYDKTMTDVQMITMKSDNQIKTVGTGLVSKANNLKVSFSEVSQAATALYRQGLSDSEVNERLDTILKFSKVSGTKADAATKLVTVATNTGLVQNASQAADVVTALGDNAATNAAEIEKGIEKAGAAAAVDGTTFGELSAMLTAITSTTQIGGNVAGRTLNTIMARMNKIGTNELIYDENGNAVSGSNVAKLLQAQGVRLYDQNGDKRSTFDVLRDLSQNWDSISDAEKNQLSTEIAGTRMYSNFAAIMQGMQEGKIDEYMDLVNNSDGIVNQKYSSYENSLEAARANLQTGFDHFVKNYFGWTTDLSKNFDNGFGGFFDALGGLLDSEDVKRAKRIANSNAAFSDYVSEKYSDVERLETLRNKPNRTSSENEEYKELITSLGEQFGVELGDVINFDDSSLVSSFENISSGAESAASGIEGVTSALQNVGTTADEAAQKIIEEAEASRKRDAYNQLQDDFTDNHAELKQQEEEARNNAIQTDKTFSNPIFSQYGYVVYDSDRKRYVEGKDDQETQYSRETIANAIAEDLYKSNDNSMLNSWLPAMMVRAYKEDNLSGNPKFFTGSQISNGRGGLLNWNYGNYDNEDAWKEWIENADRNNKETMSLYIQGLLEYMFSRNVKRDVANPAKDYLKANLSETLSAVYSDEEIDYIIDDMVSDMETNELSLSDVYDKYINKEQNEMYATFDNIIKRRKDARTDSEKFKEMGLIDVGSNGYYIDKNGKKHTRSQLLNVYDGHYESNIANLLDDHTDISRYSAEDQKKIRFIRQAGRSYKYLSAEDQAYLKSFFPLDVNSSNYKAVSTLGFNDSSFRDKNATGLAMDSLVRVMEEKDFQNIGEFIDFMEQPGNFKEWNTVEPLIGHILNQAVNVGNGWMGPTNLLPQIKDYAYANSLSYGARQRSLSESANLAETAYRLLSSGNLFVSTDEKESALDSLKKDRFKSSESYAQQLQSYFGQKKGKSEADFRREAVEQGWLTSEDIEEIQKLEQQGVLSDEERAALTSIFGSALAQDIISGKDLSPANNRVVTQKYNNAKFGSTEYTAQQRLDNIRYVRELAQNRQLDTLDETARNEYLSGFSYANEWVALQNKRKDKELNDSEISRLAALDRLYSDFEKSAEIENLKLSGDSFAYAREQYRQNNKAGLAANSVFESLSTVKNAGDLIKIMGDQRNKDNINDLLEAYPDLAKTFEDLGLVKDNLGNWDLSSLADLSTDAGALSSAFGTLMEAVAHASEQYNKYASVDTVGENYDKARKYLAGDFTPGEEETYFNALSSYLGDQQLAQVARSSWNSWQANPYGELPEGYTYLDGKVYNMQGDDVTNRFSKRPFVPFGELDQNGLNSLYLQDRLFNGPSGIEGLSMSQRYDALSTMVDALKQGGYNELTNPTGGLTGLYQGTYPGVWNNFLSGMSTDQVDMSSFMQKAMAYEQATGGMSIMNISNLEEGSEAFEVAQQTLSEFDGGIEQAKREVELLDTALIALQKEALEKTTDETKEATKALENIAEGGQKAAQQLAAFSQQRIKLQNQVFAAGKIRGKTGKQITNKKELEQIKEFFGLPDEKAAQNYIKDWTEKQSDYWADQMEQAANESFTISQFRPIMQQAFEKIQQGLDNETLQIEPVVEAVLKVQKSGDVTGIADLLSDMGLTDMVNAIMSLNGVLAHVDFGIDEEFNGKSGYLEAWAKAQDAVNTAMATLAKPSGYGGGGGGGGGGGEESEAQKMLKRHKHEVTEVEHKVKMVELHQTHYDFINDYDAYIDSLDDEVDAYSELAGVYNKHLEELEGMMGGLEEYSDDWWAVKEAIDSTKESLAELQNKLDAVQTKRIEIFIQKQEEQDKTPSHKQELWTERARQFQITGEFESYATAETNRINQLQEEIDLNNEQKKELEAQLSEVVEESDAWIKARDQLWAMTKENMTLINDMEEARRALDMATVQQMQTDMQNRLSPREHVDSMLDQYGQLYQRNRQDDYYRNTLEQRIGFNNERAEIYQASRDQIEAEMSLLEEQGRKGSEAWYAARDAINQVDEAMLQLILSTDEMNRAIEQSKVDELVRENAKVNDAYSHTMNLLKTQQDRYEKNDNFTMYLETISEQEVEARQHLEELEDQLNGYVELSKDLTFDTEAWDKNQKNIRTTEEDIENLKNQIEELVRLENQSEFEHLQELFNRQDNLDQHQIKMIQSQEALYQNRGELTNYGTMLKVENEARADRIEHLEEYLDKLKKQLEAEEKGTKEYYKVIDAIYKAEEQIESETNAIDKNTEALKKNIENILKTKKAVIDLIDTELKQRDKEQKEMLSAEVSIQNQILNVIRKRYRDEWAQQLGPYQSNCWNTLKAC